MKDQRINGVLGSPSATTSLDGKQLPPLPPEFGGVIKEAATDSTPWWAPRIVPPKGAPNVLLIMTDDQGYGVSSTFGGVIPTPALDRVAAAGLRYTEFHSTALCSPTRAAQWGNRVGATSHERAPLPTRGSVAARCWRWPFRSTSSLGGTTAPWMRSHRRSNRTVVSCSQWPPQTTRLLKPSPSPGPSPPRMCCPPKN